MKRSTVLRWGMTIVIAFGAGFYASSGIGSIGQGPTVAADNAEIHIVEEGETLWDIARSVADDRGQDIRETIYEIQINNDINEVDSLRPGQKIIIR